ncbi:response regulator [Aquabacterium sp. J223]|uniref:response regulator n=1 Tax=Aquabacterium sp. J223 TaxID=2898431 RepID=UPI0021ADD208|nr:response regulator [Aquabacterium sp. J223]UUX96884.1 response regulator [Aquabacterium sp. J223]
MNPAMTVADGPRLLLVEDEPDLAAALQRALEARGFAVTCCGNGSEAMNRLRHDPPALLLLDLTIPGLDGLQVLHKARAEQIGVPIVVLTARSAVGDRVVGLNAGADDYLGKPFDLDELEARIRALLRRHGRDTEAVQRCGRLQLDRAAGAFYVGEQVLELTPREQALLKALMATPGRAVAKERLFRLVFPMATEVQFEAIEVVAYRLRKKLAGSGTALVTLRGLGYLLREDAAT